MKKNPVRTMVTIIGIIISTAMFTAVTTLTISLYSFVYRTEIYDSGSWHVGFEYKGYDEYAGWTQSGKAEKLAAARVLGMHRAVRRMRTNRIYILRVLRTIFMISCRFI